MFDYLSQLYNLSLDEALSYPEIITEDEISEETLNYYERLKRRIKKYLHYLRRTFYVIVSDYLPRNVLGMTNCKGVIWIRRLYGYIKDHVLRHEVIHNLYPNANEYQVERLAHTGHPNLNQFNFVFV